MAIPWIGLFDGGKRVVDDGLKVSKYRPAPLDIRKWCVASLRRSFIAPVKKVPAQRGTQATQ
ncbi:hypothetical protein ASPCADRAFT_203345 [Aspergillus carbonarius ITEM 5010]|uniref:Uncharacterized protein n=1 Tax=Aspergillus carbonarius (strain ITEM 5010) TaxID=602072 RepID=A0A1R3RYL1_ASPC5|nr:hypothetical protein ASPCADRAFT_203345 [Aspergillus carbonarius ITEM 5010]